MGEGGLCREIRKTSVEVVALKGQGLEHRRGKITFQVEKANWVAERGLGYGVGVKCGLAAAVGAAGFGEWRGLEGHLQLGLHREGKREPLLFLNRAVTC